jgi:hypothetical protein
MQLYNSALLADSVVTELPTRAMETEGYSNNDAVNVLIKGTGPKLRLTFSPVLSSMKWKFPAAKCWWQVLRQLRFLTTDWTRCMTTWLPGSRAHWWRILKFPTPPSAIETRSLNLLAVFMTSRLTTQGQHQNTELCGAVVTTIRASYLGEVWVRSWPEGRLSWLVDCVSSFVRLGKYSRVLFCDGSIYDDSLLRSLPNRI